MLRRALRRCLRASLPAVAVLTASGLAPAMAQSPRPAPTSKAKPGPSPTQPEPPPKPVLPEPPLPVRDAVQAGIGQCAPILDLMSRQTLTSAYDLQSGWSRNDPAHHVFQSVIASNTPGNVPPDGVTALVAAPVTGGGCDGVAMQVFPLASDCPTAMKTMMKDGRLLGPMMNTRIMVDAKGNRIILVPAHRDTCIAIAVDTRFGTPQ